MLKKPRRRKRKAHSRSRYKKGTIFDMIPILMFAIIFAVFSFVGLRVFNEFDESGAINSTTGIAIMDESAGVYEVIDTIFVFLMVGLGITTIIAAVRIQTSPAFFFITVLLFAVVIFLAGNFSNIFDEMETSDVFTDEGDTYDKTVFIMDNLPYFILGLGALVLVVMYSVNRFQV